MAGRFTDEHRASLDWLNEITDDRFNFFGLEVELWRIGDSHIAPQFKIFSQPNDWSRSIQSSARKAAESSPKKQVQLNFWTNFKEYMEDNGSFVRCQKPSPQHWMNHAIGRSGFHMSSVASYWNSEDNAYDPEIRVEVVIDHKDSKKMFEKLFQQKDQIELALDRSLVWHNPEDKKMCRIYLKEPADFSKEENWPDQFAWLQEYLEKFHRVFSDRIKNL